MSDLVGTQIVVFLTHRLKLCFNIYQSDWDSYDSSVIEASGFGIPVKMVLQDDVSTKNDCVSDDGFSLFKCR